MYIKRPKKWIPEKRDPFESILYQRKTISVNLETKDLKNGVFVKIRDLHRPVTNANLIIRPMDIDSFRVNGGKEVIKVCPTCEKTFTVKWWESSYTTYCCDKCKNIGKKKQASLHWK